MCRLAYHNIIFPRPLVGGIFPSMLFYQMLLVGPYIRTWRSHLFYRFFFSLVSIPSIYIYTLTDIACLQITASLVYADNGAPIQKTQDNTEAPLLVGCEGLEYPSTEKPVALFFGRATFKLKISQVFLLDLQFKGLFEIVEYA